MGTALLHVENHQWLKQVSDAFAVMDHYNVDEIGGDTYAS